MPCYVGLDSSKRLTTVCVLHEAGSVVSEGSVPSDPSDITRFLKKERHRYARVGLESWALAPWLYAGLSKAGLPVICIEARHAHGILSAMRSNKTDRNDARGIAEIMRSGVFRIVHVKTPESRHVSALLTVRRRLVNEAVNLENGVRGILLSSGLKLNTGSRTTFVARVRRLVGSDTALAQGLDFLLSARATVLEELAKCTGCLERLAGEDAICRRLMTAPGVGPITALAFRAAIDEPTRFKRSRDVGPYLGLTATISQSGNHQSHGRISKRGDKVVRSLLYGSARYQLRKDAKDSWLRQWGQEIAARRGKPRALVAIARRLAVTLHRMWVTEADFRWNL